MTGAGLVGDLGPNITFRLCSCIAGLACPLDSFRLKAESLDDSPDEAPQFVHCVYPLSAFALAGSPTYG